MLIFVPCLSSSFELCEDFLSMETLAARTREEGIFIAVKNACICSGLDLKNLRGICTDGSPAMTDNQHGFVTRFSDYVSNKYDNKELINLQCIIHQEALCSKSVALNTILKDLNCIISFIRANALHHRQFREILCSSETSAEDIFYHSVSSLFVYRRNVPPCTAIAKENSKILFNQKQEVSLARQKLFHVV